MSFFEAINFYSLNYHGEAYLIQGLREFRKLHLGDAVQDYLAHFIEEEEAHQGYFSEFCQRYAQGVYPSRIPSFFKPDLSDYVKQFVFLAKALMFESVSDYFNVENTKDDRVAKVAREINQLHHRDETRHMAFGRKILSDFYDHYISELSEATQAEITNQLMGYFEAIWRDYQNPRIYIHAGFSKPFLAESLARESQWSRNNKILAETASREFFEKLGLKIGV